MTVPRLISQHKFAFLHWIGIYLIMISILMHLWCWIVVIASDPGRVSDDLARRGLLDQTLHDDIPANLAHLPICQRCRLPTPPLSHHCQHCRQCFLRHHRHLHYCGCCVADKTFKAYLLFLLWGALGSLMMFALNIALSIVLRALWPLAPGVYAACYFAVSGARAFVVMLDGWTDASFYDRALRRAGRRVPLGEILRSFGDVWWRRCIPLQRECTALAWPGVDWGVEP
jgi:hypothetical protein